MQHLSFIFNIILVFLFVRLCSKAESDFFFNPFVAFIGSRINKLLDFLKPVLALPEQMALFVIMISIFLFKTLLITRLNPTISITFGQLITCTPTTELPAQVSLLIFSLLSSIAFLFKFWTFYFVTSLIAAPHRKNRASDAFTYYARPFSSIPFLYQPFVLLGLHAVLAAVVTAIGSLTYLPLGTDVPLEITLSSSPFIIRIVKTVWLGVLSFSDAIMVMIQVLFVGIIGSIIATVMRKGDLMTICNEASDMVLGRFSRRASSGAGMDFTPIIFFFAAHYGYSFLSTFLTSLISTPVQLPF